LRSRKRVEWSSLYHGKYRVKFLELKAQISFQNDHVKEGEMGRACSTHKGSTYRVLVRQPEGK
jgi:hypothetical protein